MGDDLPGYTQPCSHRKAAKILSFHFNNKPDNIAADGVEKIQEFTQKIALLKKQLAWGKLRSAALDTMINIPEKQADISFRKKSGTQQSG